VLSGLETHVVLAHQTMGSHSQSQNMRVIFIFEMIATP